MHFLDVLGRPPDGSSVDDIRHLPEREPVALDGSGGVDGHDAVDFSQAENVVGQLLAHLHALEHGMNAPDFFVPLGGVGEEVLEGGEHG